MRAAALAACAALVLAVPAGAATRVHEQGFESSFGGWVPDHEIACETGQPPCRFVWEIARSEDRARTGRVGLRAYLDGRNDDGTIWIERSFPVRRRTRTTVRLSFWLWSPAASDVNTWPVVAFISTREAEREGDFMIVGETDRAAGWQRYSHSRSIRSRSGVVHVALGFGATWETPRTYFIDDVRVTRRSATVGR